MVPLLRGQLKRRTNVNYERNLESWTPFMCQVTCRPNLLSDPVRLQFFVKAPDPHTAIMGFTQSWFTELYKTQRGVDPESRFPDLHGQGEAITLDDGDWEEYLRDAVRLYMRGNQKYTVHFRAEPGYPPMGFHVEAVVMDHVNVGEVDYFKPLLKEREKVEIELPNTLSDEFQGEIERLRKEHQIRAGQNPGGT